MADRGSSMLDATAAAGDPVRLRAFLAERGYLLLRGALDADLVRRVRDDLIAILHDCHILESPAAPPIWSGGPPPTEEEYMVYYERAVRLDSFNRLSESPEVRAVIEAIYDGPVQVWTQRLLRIIPPDPEGAAPLGVGAHQDGSPQLGYLTQDFCTAWIPLTDIDERLGGLAVVPGSHRGGVRAQTGAASSSLKTAKDQVFELPSADEEWVTTTYSPGDLVVFASMTLHKGMPNVSDRLRLSCDFRYQPQGAYANWLAHTSGPEVRRTAQQIDAVVGSRALYVTTHADADLRDAVRRRMMEERSTTLERARELAAELAGGCHADE
jgi:1-deoxypentalenic acid 11beta-hydroxylase